RDFELPSNALLERMPDFVVKSLLGILKARPEVDPDKCTGCEFCIQNCPVAVMQLRDRVPAIDYNRCISCLCCQELCPQQAVELKQHHPAGRLLAAMMKYRRRRRNRRYS
ncbi:4Fe-4S dicluster domain-containing protein, partial [bacterium]